MTKVGWQNAHSGNGESDGLVRGCVCVGGWGKGEITVKTIRKPVEWARNNEGRSQRENSERATSFGVQLIPFTNWLVLVGWSELSPSEQSLFLHLQRKKIISKISQQSRILSLLCSGHSKTCCQYLER